MLTRSLAAVAGLALTVGTLALSTPAQAAPVSDDGVAISYGDLDLASASGAARFERRARNAARSLCGWNQIQPIEMQRQVTACQEQVVANARSDVRTAQADNGGSFRLTLRTN